MADTRVLLKGLEKYQEQLSKHVARLQQDYQELETRWTAFRNVYEGNAADEFKGKWEQTRRGFQEYVEQTQQIMQVLKDRIDALRKADQQENLFS